MSLYTTLIDVAQLTALLHQGPTPLLLDCRFDLTVPDSGEAAYLQGHLPGAYYLHLDRDLSGQKTGHNGRHPLPERETLEARLRQLGLNQHQQVVVYDAQGDMFNETLDARGGHIPGARNRFFRNNLRDDGRFKPASTLREELEAVLGAKSAEQSVHSCGSGVTACHNLLALEIAGLSGAKLYPGSWSEWSSDPDAPVATGH